GPLCVLSCFDLHLEEPYLSHRIDELGVSRLLDHPKLERFVDHGRTDAGLYWRLTELPPGRDASTLRPRSGLPPPDLDTVLAAFADFAEGLDAAHGLTQGGMPLGLVHGWINPSTLLLGEDGVGRVVDWGLSGLVRGSDDRS